MKASHILIPIFLISLTFSCKNKQETVTTDKVTHQGILVDSYDSYQESATVNISEVVLEGNLLKLSFSYSGGCEKHEFTLIGLNAISKSLPPSRPIMLYHNGNGDSCRELISETMEFNISDFGYKKKEEIKLMLQGYDNPISYTLQ